MKHKLMYRVYSNCIHFITATDYSRVVISAKDDGDLLTESSLKDMCRLEEKLIRQPYYSDICQTVTHDRCCIPWSLPNYIAMLHNRSSCYNITVCI